MMKKRREGGRKIYYKPAVLRQNRRIRNRTYNTATSIENENTGHTIKIVKTAYQSCLHENKQKPIIDKNFRELQPS